MAAVTQACPNLVVSIMMLVTVAVAGCPNACSGHGTCTQNQCVCDLSFALNDCSTNVKDPANMRAYNAYRVGFLSAFCALAAAGLWRTTAVTISKYQRMPRASSRMQRVKNLLVDAQTQALFLASVNFCLNALYFVDPLRAEGIWSFTFWSMLPSFFSFAILLCNAAVVRMFAQIVARFHPPTRRVLSALNWLCVGLCICYICRWPTVLSGFNEQGSQMEIVVVRVLNVCVCMFCLKPAFVSGDRIRYSVLCWSDSVCCTRSAFRSRIASPSRLVRS